MKGQKLLYLLLLVLTTIQLKGQSIISGQVKDQFGESIPGANIYIKDSFDGTNSKPDGSFKFETYEEGDQVLVISFIGFETIEQTITLDGNTLELPIILQESINKLDGVTITAGAFEASEVKKSTVLKPLDIVTTASAAGDIMGAINTLPGTTAVGESGRVFVRGGEGYETKVFIDGLEVRNAFNSTIPNVPTRGRFSPFLFKGTVFSTGGYSAEYGQALSSVLVLNSNDKAIEDKTEISVMSVGGDISHTKAWQKTSISGKIQYTDLRPYQEIISQDFDWQRPPHGFVSELVFRQQVGKDGLLKVYGNFDHSDFAIREYNLNTDAKDTIELGNDYHYINASYKDILNKDWSIRGGLTYTSNVDDIQFNGQRFKDVSSGWHAKAALNWDGHSKLSLNTGMEVFTNQFDRTIYSEEGNGTFGFNDELTAGFAELDFFASNRFVVRTGLRVEHSSLLQDTWLSPRVAASYKPSEKGQFSLAYGKFYQQAQNQYSLINRGLKPEIAQHYIANYQYTNLNQVFRIEAFYKDYEDLVTFQDPNDFDPSHYGNLGYGKAQGIDVFWRDAKTIKNTDYWISYSFTDADRLYQDYPENAAPSFLAKHNFRFVVKHFVEPLRTQFGATYSFASERLFHNPNQPGFENDATPYFADLSLNAAFLIKPHIILYTSCSNVLGRDNVFGYEFADQPNGDGFYQSMPITQPAKRFVFVGLFITLTKDGKQNQLENL